MSKNIRCLPINLSGKKFIARFVVHQQLTCQQTVGFNYEIFFQTGSQDLYDTECPIPDTRY